MIEATLNELNTLDPQTIRLPRKQRAVNPKKKRRGPPSLGYDLPRGGGILRIPCGGGYRVVRQAPSYDGESE